tara:strand:+ start:1036 stop:1293 length:258 start_codon:yes stop_codon:yes gene_type:complete
MFKKYYIPSEIFVLIYKFLNPISFPYHKERNLLWCKKCGEILKKGDWFLNLQDEEYLVYECIICGEENIFYEDIDCDIILRQENE